MWNRGVRSRRLKEIDISQHRNARLTVHGGLDLVRRIEQGRPAAHVADEVGVSRTTAHRLWSRYQAEGKPLGMRATSR